ncbi:MAG: hypothetical protein HY658_01235 [Actinobacteria bacterium]|nr:hypothetical protein [Actinomycetota bacterium]
MNDHRWERAAAAGGLVFTILFVAGGLLFADQPGRDATAREFSSFLADAGNRNRTEVAALLWGLAGVSLLWFTGTLRAHLRLAEGGPGRISGVAFGGGVALAVLLLASGASFAAVPGSIDYYPRLQADAWSAATFFSLSFWLFSAAGVGAAVLVAATSVLTFRAGAFPRWVGWAGFAVALASLFSLFGWPFLAVPAWLVVVSVLLVRAVGASTGPSTRESATG